MQLFVILSACICSVFYFIYKQKLALENDNKELKKEIDLTKKAFELVNRIHLKEKSLNKELREEIQWKNCQILELEKEEILKRELEKQIENQKIEKQNLLADKKKLFDLVEKTIDRKPSITHENVHQKITWSQNTINSSPIDSSIIVQAEQEVTLELRAKNQDLTTKLESVRTILRQHLLVDLNEGNHRLDRRFVVLAGSADRWQDPGRFPFDNPCPKTRPLVRTKSQNRL